MTKTVCSVLIIAAGLAGLPAHPTAWAQDSHSFAESLSRLDDRSVSRSSAGTQSALGQSFARAAKEGEAGYSMGRCYEFVWSALRSVLGWQIEDLPVPATSAYQFGDWVDAHPQSARSGLALARWKGSARTAPVGSVLVWNPGQCGYSSEHGHIEIKVSTDTACSDFCQAYTKCSEPRVYAPVR